MTAVAAIVGLIASMALVASQPAAAQSSRPCVGASPGHHFAGYATSQNIGRVGAAGVVTTRATGPYCIGHSWHFASAWTMTASSDSSGWAQSGYDTALCGAPGCGSQAAPRYFAQSAANWGTTVDTWVGGLAPVGGNELYYSYADWTCGCARMFVGLYNQVLVSSFNPYASWSGSTSQFFSETSDPANHIPGFAATPVDYTAIAELPFLGAWTGAGINVSWGLDGGLGNWTRTPFTTCLDGQRCFGAYSN
jgi:hypothetical protein